MDFSKLVDVNVTKRDDAGRLVHPAKRKAAIGYTSRKNTGTATVVNGYTGETGEWVTLHDKARNATLVVRPSQVSA